MGFWMTVFAVMIGYTAAMTSALFLVLLFRLREIKEFGEMITDANIYRRVRAIEAKVAPIAEVFNSILANSDGTGDLVHPKVEEV